MYNFKYVSKKNAADGKHELIEIINKVQDFVRDDFNFTFQFYFIGSSSRNMITYDPDSNIGFDFDVNLEVNDCDQKYNPKEIKHIFMRAFDKVIIPYGYSCCENSTRVITIKKIDRLRSRIIQSCDFAIVRNYVNNSGAKQQQYICFNKRQNQYNWKMQSWGYCTEKKADWLNKNGHWQEVRNRYIEKKNYNEIKSKKSSALYAETINEIYMKYKN